MDVHAEKGVISSVRKSFGFIAVPGRVRDVFFHVSSLEDCKAEQLHEGTTVTFVLGKDPVSGKPIAQHVRLAPIGTRVRLHQVEPLDRVGWVVEPASLTGGRRGMVRFVDDDGRPEHLPFGAADVVLPPQLGPATQPQPQPLIQPPAAPSLSDMPALASAPPHVAASPAAGSLVLFRVSTDTRAAKLAERAAAAAATPYAATGCPAASAAATATGASLPATSAAAASGGGSGGGGGGGGPCRPPRRAAYQCAVAVRPLAGGPGALEGAQRHHALVLRLLADAVQASREMKPLQADGAAGAAGGAAGSSGGDG